VKSAVAFSLLVSLLVPATGFGAGGSDPGSVSAPVPSDGDYTVSFDTLYNSLTIDRRGSVVEMRARSRRGQFIESAVDVDDPLNLVVAYTRTLYGALFIQPEPERVLMIGLGGAGFHRLFVEAYPESLIHSVELDEKVFELSQSHLGFRPNERTPVTIMDGRLFVKRNREQWDLIILDAFRGGYVPPHLKTQEFYRECAARLGPRGVFVSNLHCTTELYFADLKTIKSVFPQIVMFRTIDRCNVIVCAVNYSDPDITDPSTWPSAPELNLRLRGRLNMESIRRERADLPLREIGGADLLTDDFAPVEFLDAMTVNNTGRDG
jgi:spermidine synthase